MDMNKIRKKAIVILIIFFTIYVHADYRNSDTAYEKLKNLLDAKCKKEQLSTASVTYQTISAGAMQKQSILPLINLEGCKLVASDGTFLGIITWNEYDPNSIFNSVGRYGSSVSPTSIWNDVCQYGSDISSKSAFNDLASSPPLLVRDETVIGYLTLNISKRGAIHPLLLLSALDSSADEMYKKKLMNLH
jgi:hypothetical protein